MNDVVRVVALKRPLSTQRLEVCFEPGRTVADMVRECGLDPDVVAARVTIDGRVVESAVWEHVCPRAGQLIAIRVIPRGGDGGGKDVLRIVAMVGVLALAIAAPYLAPAAWGLIGAGGALTLTGTAVTAGLAIGGSLLLGALIPPPSRNISALGGISTDRSPSLSLNGGQNEMRPYQPVPKIYGIMRVFPPMAAEPYTEIVANEQYLRLCFCIGYGPLHIPESEFRIGQTPLSQFTDVEVEVRQGYDSDLPLTLFSNDVHEEALSLSLNASDGYQQRTSLPDADELSVDVTLPGGLFRTKDDGTLVSLDLTIQLEYRKIGDTTWIIEPPINWHALSPREVQRWGWVYIGNRYTIQLVNVTEYDEIPGTAKMIRVGHRWKPITGSGQYEVRMIRLTPDSDDLKISDKAIWTAFRTIKAQHPVKMKNVALVAMRIKATDQLNGTVDQFNCVAQSILPAWKGGSWTSIPTSNPSAIYRDIFQGAANDRPLADNRLDLPTLQSWAELCDANNRTCNIVFDFQSTVFEAARLVAATGRASFDIRDGKYSVVLDKPQENIVQLFTPRNSWGFKGHKTYPDLPHGLKITFQNAKNDWLQDFRYVYADGYSEKGENGTKIASKFDSLDLLGITDPDNIFKDGRYNFAQAILRPETYEIMTDVENLVCTRGDLVGVVHDVPQWGLGQGRVVSMGYDEVGDTIAITMDDPLDMDGLETRYAIRVRLNDGQTAAYEVQNVAGTQWTLVPIEPIPRAVSPMIGNLLAYGELNADSVRLIVKSIDPKNGLEALITLIDEAPDVHTADIGPIPRHDPQMTIPYRQRKPNQPVVDAILSDESVLERDMDGSLRVRIVIKIHYVSGGMPAKRVEVRYRRSLSADIWQQAATPVSGDVTELEIPQVTEKSFYDLLIRAVSPFEVASDPITFNNYFVIGRTTPPPDVLTVNLQDRRLRWSYPNPPRDMAGFLVRMHYGARPFWDDAIEIHDGVIPASFYDLDRASGQRTYLVKAVDSAGYWSEHPAVIVVDWGNRLIGNAVEEIDYGAAGFPGVIEGGQIVLGHIEAFADLPFWTHDFDPLWTNDSAPFWGSSFTGLSYTFSYIPLSVLSVGTMFISADVEGVYTIQYRTDSLLPFWGIDADPFWTGDSKPFWSGKGEWLPWPGQLTGLIRQEYDFRIVVNPGFTQGVINDVFVVVDMPDVTEKIREFTISSSGSVLPITKSYFEITGVAVSLLQGNGDARYVIVQDKNATGPFLKAYDGNGAQTSALVDVDIEGY